MKILLSSRQIQNLAFSPFLFRPTFISQNICCKWHNLVSLLARSEEDQVVYLYGLLQPGTPLALGLVTVLLQ